MALSQKIDSLETKVLNVSERLISNGSSYIATRVLTSDATLSQGDYCIFCDTSGGVVTITPPDAGKNKGKVYIIKKISSDTTAMNVAGLANGTIVIVYQYESLTIVSDGTNWQIIGSYILQMDNTAFKDLNGNLDLSGTLELGGQIGTTIFASQAVESSTTYNSDTFGGVAYLITVAATQSGNSRYDAQLFWLGTDAFGGTLTKIADVSDGINIIDTVAYANAGVNIHRIDVTTGAGLDRPFLKMTKLTLG